MTRLIEFAVEIKRSREMVASNRWGDVEFVAKIGKFPTYLHNDEEPC